MITRGQRPGVRAYPATTVFQTQHGVCRRRMEDRLGSRLPPRRKVAPVDAFASAVVFTIHAQVKTHLCSLEGEDPSAPRRHGSVHAEATAAVCNEGTVRKSVERKVGLFETLCFCFAKPSLRCCLFQVWPKHLHSAADN